MCIEVYERQEFFLTKLDSVPEEHRNQFIETSHLYWKLKSGIILYEHLIAVMKYKLPVHMVRSSYEKGVISTKVDFSNSFTLSVLDKRQNKSINIISNSDIKYIYDNPLCEFKLVRAGGEIFFPSSSVVLNKSSLSTFEHQKVEEFYRVDLFSERTDAVNFEKKMNNILLRVTGKIG